MADKIIKRIPLFDCFSEAELAAIDKMIQKKRFSKNGVILLEEDTSNYLYIVYSGKVKAVQTSADGREHILAVKGRGEFFGEMGILDGKTAPATVMAMEEAEVGLISKEDFEGYLLTNERFVKHMVLVLCSRLRESWMMLKVLALPEAENRVRAVLKLISDQYGIKDARGTMISLKLTHKDIARHASLSRETVTRQLDRLLKADEIVILEDRRILLKPVFFEKAFFW
jgi:CRP/FNR family cyclic AMP-dependent transcriptional regulator